MKRLSAFCLCLFLSCQNVDSDLLQVSINTDGSFYVNVGQYLWLGNSWYGIHCGGEWYSTKPGHGKLEGKGILEAHGTDIIGPFSETIFVWKAGSVEWRTALRRYDDQPAFAIFRQEFTDGCTSGMPTVVGDTYDTGITDATSAFPSFDVRLNGTNVPELNYITFADANTGGTYLGHVWDGKFRGGTRSGLPLVLYDRNNTALVLSPLDNFLESVLVSNQEFGGSLIFGMNGKTARVPPRHNVSFVMYASNWSVNDALEKWGDLLLLYYRKARTAVDQNLSLRKLGYATDNGAFYYYLTEKGKSYQGTLLDLEAYFNKTSLPVAYLQLDSWWYPKAEGDDGGCLVWEPFKSVFPDGMQVLSRPLWLHSRYFSPQSPYKETYKFVASDYVSHPCLLPLDDAFFRNIMKKANGWESSPGMIVYEQDWMGEVMRRVDYSYSEPGAAAQWLQAMNVGAESVDASLQWDTAYPSQIMYSVTAGQVTQASSNNDYQPGNSQWDDALHDMLFDAVGIVPWKDTFWTTETQPGCPSKYSSCNGCSEPNTELQTLIAVVSTGPVTPGDGLGYANAQLLKRTCMSDATLLKPDRPLLPLPKVFVESFESLAWPRVLFTKAEPSTRTGTKLMSWYYVFAADLEADFVVYPEDVADGLEAETLVAFQLMAIDVNHSGRKIAGTPQMDVIPFSRDKPLVIQRMPKAHDTGGCGRTVPFVFYLISPRLSNGYALIGELAKLVPLNRQRVFSVSADGDDQLVVGLRGSDDEKVTFSVIYPNSTLIDSIECIFNAGKVDIHCGDSKCKCEYTNQ
eukprot:m.72771 g.72771  ORF g.72771 m.72771 type:complete len:798 (+) comp35812_c0_seq1:25-2418(+)